MMPQGAVSLMREIESIAMQAGALARHCERLHQDLQAAIKAAKPSEPEPVEDESGNCLHPKDSRVAIPAMGQPHRFSCTRCGKISGGVNEG